MATTTPPPYTPPPSRVNSTLDPNADQLVKSPSLDTPRRSSETAGDKTGTTASIKTPTPTEVEMADTADTATDGGVSTKRGSIVSDESSETGDEVKVVKYSSMKSPDNPLTMERERRIQEGAPLIVKFDERVVVHTVPYWDPCGETFYDKDNPDGPRGPNCCAVL